MLGTEATLANIISPQHQDVVKWIIIGLLSVGFAIYLLRAPKQRFVIGWGWKTTGAVVGIIALAAWVLSSLSYRDYGLSFTQPTVSLVRLVLFADDGGVNWATYLVLAVPVGAFVAALVGKDFSLRISRPGRFLAQTGGGVLMGVGASIAGGCNIGHGITGVSTLAVSSIVQVVFTMLGVWLVTYLVQRGLKAREHTAA